MTYTHKIITRFSKKAVNEEFNNWDKFLYDLKYNSPPINFKEFNLNQILEREFNIIGVVLCSISKRRSVIEITFKTEEDFMMFKLKYL